MGMFLRESCCAVPQTVADEVLPARHCHSEVPWAILHPLEDEHNTPANAFQHPAERRNVVPRSKVRSALVSNVFEENGSSAQDGHIAVEDMFVDGPLSLMALPATAARRPRCDPGQLRRVCHGGSRHHVSLHVYDLSVMSRLIGIPFFHFGVEVHGREYFFGSRGIRCCRPGLNPRHVHREAVLVGFTLLSREVVAALRDQMKREWCGGSYSPLTKDCLSFAEAFCQKLGVAKGSACIPERFSRLPKQQLSLCEASCSLPGMRFLLPCGMRLRCRSSGPGACESVDVDAVRPV